jgi:hypothetical protein
MPTQVSQLRQHSAPHIYDACAPAGGWQAAVAGLLQGRDTRGHFHPNNMGLLSDIRETTHGTNIWQERGHGTPIHPVTCQFLSHAAHLQGEVVRLLQACSKVDTHAADTSQQYALGLWSQ